MPISLKRGFDFMGNMGTLAELMKRPEIAARLEQGEKEGGAEARKYLEDLTARTKPVRKVAKTEQVDLGDRKFLIRYDETGKEVRPRGTAQSAAPRMFAPPRAGGAGGAPEATLDDETLTSMAEQYLAGDKSVFQNLGRGAQGAANVVALRQRVTQVARKPACHRTRSRSCRTSSRHGAAAACAGHALSRTRASREESYAMADTRDGGRLLLPRAVHTDQQDHHRLRGNTGDPEARQFGAALNSFINAYTLAR